MSRKKSPLTIKGMLLMIIKQHGMCRGINSIHCQGGGTSSQRYTQCPINCISIGKRHSLPNERQIYELAVNKFIKAFGQEALVEALM